MYHEKAGIYDEVEDYEVDLVSEALSIWEYAQEKYPDIAQKIEQLPNVVYSTRQHQGDEINPQGVLVYMRTSDGVDALAYVNKRGESVTQSQSRILRLARCELETPAIPRHPQHFDLVAKGADLISQQQKKMADGGRLGSPNSARAKTYTRLSGYVDDIRKHTPLLAQGTEWNNLTEAIQHIYDYPLQERAITKLNRQLRSRITNKELAKLVVSLHEDSLLCVKHEEKEVQDSQIICSLGLFEEKN